jgi:CO/xanthine dehydrogenase Mo-binding subunit
VPLKRPDGSPFYVAEPLPLPVDRVRFVGEAVAMVVAETALAARDGAERVIVDWTVGVDRLEEDRAARHMISHTMEMMLVALSVI